MPFCFLLPTFSSLSSNQFESVSGVFFLPGKSRPSLEASHRDSKLNISLSLYPFLSLSVSPPTIKKKHPRAVSSSACILPLIRMTCTQWRLFLFLHLHLGPSNVRWVLFHLFRPPGRAPLYPMRSFFFPILACCIGLFFSFR